MLARGVKKSCKTNWRKTRLRHVLFLTPSLWKTHKITTVECAEGFKDRNKWCWKGKMEQNKGAIVSVLAATALRRGRVWVRSFLNLAPDEGEKSSSQLYRFTPKKRAPSSHRTAGWVGPTAGLHVLEKKKSSSLSGNRTTIFGLPARSLPPTLTPVSRLRTMILRS
jgi:hypothetical protein